VADFTLDLKAKAVTLPVAAYAAGVTPRTFRGWLEGTALVLLVPRTASGAWLRVAPVDLVRLAVLGRLVQFGFRIAEAGAIVREHIDRQIEAVIMVGGDLESKLRGLSLNVSHEPSGLAVSVTTIFGTRPAKHTTAVLSIAVGYLASEARKRVRERVGAE
jgi:hypothetical protein